MPIKTANVCGYEASLLGSGQYRSLPLPVLTRSKCDSYFVGVGMVITDHPLHRSGRALLTHPALALGADAKPQLRIRVMQRRPWQPKINQAAHPLPGESR